MSNQETAISLESYAAVIAGLGAGLSLQRALAHADVPPSAWERAAEDWQARIDESAASDLALLVTFDAALLAAKRPFEPTVEPIASDPRAWTHFRRHFVTAVDPIAFLAQHGISLATYARMEADWANRALAEEAVAAAIRSHLEAPLEECPTLTLIPSPLIFPKGADSPSKASAVSSPREPTLIDEEAVATPILPRVALDSAAVARSPLPFKAPLHEESDPLEIGTEAWEDISKTAPPPPVVPAAPLPFTTRGSSPGLPLRPEASMEAQEAWQASEPQSPEVSTVIGSLIPGSPVLPFRSAEVPPEQRSGRAALGSQPDAELSPPGVATTGALEMPRAPVLPFRPPVEGPRAGSWPLPPPDQPGASGHQPIAKSPEVLSLSQYASLCAELALAPGRAEAIFKRYGLDTREKRSLVDAVWKERFRHDPGEYGTWQEMYRRYHAYWSKRGVPSGEGL